MALKQSGKTYFLTQDIVDKSLGGSCFTIKAPGITLDCQGHRIIADIPLWKERTGIYSNQPYTTIKDCYVYVGNKTGWTTGSVGIKLENADNSVVYNNTLRQAYEQVLVASSGNVTVEGNDIDMGGQGIVLKSSSGSLVTNNIAYHGYFGLLLDGSSNNVIEGNDFSHSSSGMMIKAGSGSNMIRDNAANSCFYGLNMESSSGNEVTGNVLNSNTYSGILLIKSSWNTISGTTANFNQNGMQLVTDSNYNVITGNNADRNSQYGLYLQANSSWNRIFENAFSSNSRHGILVYMSPYNEITSNNISSNRINGLYLFFSPGSWISYNKACNNTNYDVYCNSSLGNAGTENVFSKVKACYDGWPVLWTDYSDCVVAASETASLETLDEGVPGVFYFNGWNVLIDNINVEVNDSMEDVSITVSKLREKPAYAIADLPGERDYAFLNITAANMSMGNVVNVTINFAVEKSWLSDNAINQSTVKMHRYDGGSWTPLQTDITGEDWWYVYYSAVTSHLTDFAISGDRMTGAQTGVASGSAPGFAATPLVMAVAAVILFAFVTMHGRKKKI